MKRKYMFLGVGLLLLLIAALLLGLRGCVGTRVPMPAGTGLEFYITQRVSEEDLVGHIEKYGLMGGREYYGTGYEPIPNEQGRQADPAHCVIYTVTAYPDYASPARHVTGILITDPAVTLCGVTADSPAGQIIQAMEAAGYRHREQEGLVFTRGRVTVRFTDDAIRIVARVTNRWGIQF